MAKKRRNLPRLFYTAVEVAAMLGMDRRVIADLCKNDEIPCMKLPGCRLYLIPAGWLSDLGENVQTHFESLAGAAGEVPNGSITGEVPAPDNEARNDAESSGD